MTRHAQSFTISWPLRMNASKSSYIGRHIVILTYSRLLFFPSFGHASVSHKFSCSLHLQRLLMSCSFLAGCTTGACVLRGWFPLEAAGHICGHMSHHHHRQDE